MIEVLEVPGNCDDFVRLPFALLKEDPCFVPQLNREMKVHFSEDNPFFNDATGKFFLARKDGRISGRIVSFMNRKHNEIHGERTGFFGFFDCVNDPAVSAALFDRAAEYLSREGMKAVRGPMNFSTNEECGFLIEGFDSPPMIMMPYNPPYYNDLAEAWGLRGIKDLYAYIYEMQEELPEKVLRVAAIAEKRGITVRSIDMKRFIEEMMAFKDVYHSAWESNWGFVPMSEEELLYAAGRLKQIVVPEMIIIAEFEGSPIGFMGLIPDFNFVLRRMGGKLNPLTLVKALYWSRKIRDTRVMLLGIKKEYRNRGVEALLFRKGFPPLKKGKYLRVEFSWILEDNIPIQRTIETIGGRLYKKYRVYEKPL